MTNSSLPSLEQVEDRCATYYCQRFGQLAKEVHDGGGSNVIAEFKKDWGQIEKAQKWAADKHTKHCTNFVSVNLNQWGLLQTVLTETQRVHWFERAVTAFETIQKLQFIRRNDIKKISKKMAEKQQQKGICGIYYVDESPVDISLGLALWGLGQAFTNQDRFGKAERALNRALLKMIDSTSTNLVNEIKADIGYLYLRMGKFKKARKLLKQSVTGMLGENNQIGAVTAYGNLGLVELSCRRLNDAEKIFIEALNVLEQYSITSPIIRSKAMISSHLGTLLLQRGEFQQAAKHLSLSIDLYEAQGDIRGATESHAKLSCLHHLEGKTLDGLKMIDQACDTADAFGDDQLIKYVQLIRTKLRTLCSLAPHHYTPAELIGRASPRAFRPLSQRLKIAYFLEQKAVWVVSFFTAGGTLAGICVAWCLGVMLNFWEGLEAGMMGAIIGSLGSLLIVRPGYYRVMVCLSAALQDFYEGRPCEDMDVKFGLAVRKFPHNIKILYMYASWLDLHDQNDKALDILYPHTMLIVSDKDLAIQYAWALADRGDIDEAEKWWYLAKGLVDDQTSLAVLADTKTWILYRKGKYKEAFEEIKLALPLINKAPIIAYHAAEVLSSLCNYLEANRYLEIALKSSMPFAGRAAAERLRHHLLTMSGKF